MNIEGCVPITHPKEKYYRQEVLEDYIGQKLNLEDGSYSVIKLTYSDGHYEYHFNYPSDWSKDQAKKALNEFCF